MHAGSAGRAPLRASERGKVIDDAPGEFSGLDDFEVIAERRQVTQAIAALADR